MATQAQGKGKKKGKETMKVSLDEFNQIDTPHGHSVVSLKMTGIDWAETMADHDQQTAETQQIIVPSAPRAQRGPGVDIDSLPAERPFRASLYNLPITAEEKDISDKFFQGLDVIGVEMSKTTTTVEFNTRNDLYEALCKDGHTFKGKTLNVCLYGHQPQSSYGSDRYGRGGGAYGDRYGDRGSSGGFGARSDRYGDRTTGYGRERESGFGFNRPGAGGMAGGGGFGLSRGVAGGGVGGSGFSDRFGDRGNSREGPRGSYASAGGESGSEESMNWRARPNVKPSPPPPPAFNGARRSYMQPRPEPSNYPPPSLQQVPPSRAPEERPRLVINKRTTPLNLEDVNRNEAIFGQAKPSSKPYQKMNEVEEKLKAVHISDKKDDSKPAPQPEAPSPQ